MFYQDAPKYCHPFFDLVQTDNLLEELELSRKATYRIFDMIQPYHEDYAYAHGKWTIKEVIRHIIDCERIYTYRAFRFSRFDGTELNGFDENKYIDGIKGLNCRMIDLIEEYTCVRNSTIILFKLMTDDMLDFRGRANKALFTPRSLGFMTVGHNLHHIYMIKDLYLKVQ